MCTVVAFSPSLCCHPFLPPMIPPVLIPLFSLVAVGVQIAHFVVSQYILYLLYLMTRRGFLVYLTPEPLAVCARIRDCV